MRKWVSKYKGTILKCLILILIAAAVSILSAFILYLFGVISFNDGIHFNAELFESFTNTWYGTLLFIIYQAILKVLLCIIPGSSMAFTLLCTQIYGWNLEAFLVSFSSIIISSTILYAIGRFGGYKLATKFLGETDAEKALGLLRDKGSIYFPFMMLFPIFPDDALVMIAGTTKMSLKWFIPSIIIGRGIGAATVVFGISIIPFEDFTSIYDWIVFITVCAFWIIFIFNNAHKLNKKMELRQQKRIEEQIANEEVY
jgi:uncharacterized membrane protein YdjX (TVP38/TMEM64 family)